MSFINPLNDTRARTEVQEAASARAPGFHGHPKKFPRRQSPTPEFSSRGWVRGCLASESLPAGPIDAVANGDLSSSRGSRPRAEAPRVRPRFTEHSPRAGGHLRVFDSPQAGRVAQFEGWRPSPRHRDGLNEPESANHAKPDLKLA